MADCRGTTDPEVARACEGLVLAARGADWETVAKFLGYQSVTEARAAVLNHLGREMNG